jgi:hypothetical protein
MMLLEDCPLAHSRICSIMIVFYVDNVVSELIGPLVMSVFRLSLSRGSRIDIRGRPRLFKTDELPIKPSRCQKRASAERFFSAHFATFLFGRSRPLLEAQRVICSAATAAVR